MREHFDREDLILGYLDRKVIAGGDVCHIAEWAVRTFVPAILDAGMSTHAATLRALPALTDHLTAKEAARVVYGMSHEIDANAGVVFAQMMALKYAGWIAGEAGAMLDPDPQPLNTVAASGVITTIHPRVYPPGEELDDNGRRMLTDSLVKLLDCAAEVAVAPYAALVDQLPSERKDQR